MNETIQAPASMRFLVNPALASLQWDPEPAQLLEFKNPSYLNSLWLGTVWNALLVPQRAWQLVIKPTLFGGPLWASPLRAALCTAVFGGVCLHELILGLTGHLRAVGLTEEMLQNCQFMTEREALEAIQRGDYRLVKAERA